MGTSIVRVKNATQKSKPNHETTEQISWRILDENDLKQEVVSGVWKGTSSIAALAVCGLV